MKLIVGLGNPGLRYEVTRHNVGFMSLDLLAEKLDTDFRKRAHFSYLAETQVGKEKIFLLKPVTYMNLSGKAVADAVKYYRLNLSDILIVYDDLDLEAGRLRVRPRGSAGGHKGMDSIILSLASEEIPRIRIGIGRPDRDPVIDYVLTPFTDADWDLVKPVIYQAADAAALWIKEGITAVMNRYNA